jgi:hypothetical protein
MAQIERGGDFFVSYTAAERAVAVVSAAYLASPYCTDECSGAFLHHDARRSLLLMRAEDC